MKLNLSTKKILIVEDYPAMRKAITNMLYTLEAEYIVETNNAVKALKAMSKIKFDIVALTEHVKVSWIKYVCPVSIVLI